jgi:hypothetical protein
MAAALVLGTSLFGGVGSTPTRTTSQDIFIYNPTKGNKMTTKEVDMWLDTDEWRLAVRIHKALCKRGHQMDQCWGLISPYDLNQPRLSSIQREYLSRAKELIRLTGGVVEAERIMFALDPNWITPKEIR